MPAKRERPAGGKVPDAEPAPTEKAFMRKQITLDAATLDGLKVIQEAEPDVRGDSAAIRYAVRATVERIAARKARKL